MSNFKANLFRDAVSSSSFAGAPRLVPNTGGAASEAQGSNSDASTVKATDGQTEKVSTQVVNVHAYYPWTVTDDARNYIPKLRLIEYRLTQASELNGAYQTLRGSLENLAFGSKIALSDAGAAQNQKINNAFGNSVTSNAQADLKASLNNNKDIQGFLLNSNENDILAGIGTQYMNSYRGLYTVQPTNWEYVLPYLGASNMMNNTNTFSDYNFMTRFITPFANLASSVASKTTSPDSGKFGILKALKDVPAMTNVAIAGEPGAIKAEAPQSFTGATKESLQVTFYLLNTISPEHIRMNWEFCYLFSYQNLPNRRSINLLDAPRIYTAQILGYKTIPACYISDLKIENVGAVRMIDIGEPSAKQHATNMVQSTFTKETPTMRMIPEAYKVTFTLQSVFINSQNLFRLTLEPGGGVVSTSTSTSNANPFFNAAAPFGDKNVSYFTPTTNEAGLVNRRRGEQ